MKPINKLLKACRKAGYKQVKIKNGVCYASPDVLDDTGWCAIWGILRRLGFYAGCGWHNAGQIAMKSQKELPEGIYDLEKQ